MLRRRSLKSTSDLRGRKSTSSTHGVHLEHIDAAQAQRDAQIAASQAYTRAQNRSNADITLFPLTPESSPRRHQHKRSTPRRDLHHRQSVRFVGPCSVQAKASKHDDDCDASSLQSYILGNDTYTSSQPPRHPRRAPPPVPLSGMATGYLESLAAADEYYTPEDNIASLPSSYRRLRRSRSVFSSDVQASNGGDEVQLLTTNHTRKLFYSEPRKMEHEPNVPQLRAPKSMSFLKNRHLLRSGSSSNHQDDAEAARYSARQLELQPGPKTSALFDSRGRGGGAELRMRKSLRSSSSSAEGSRLPAFNTDVPVNKQENLKFKARKVSKSFKTKLKSFFNLSKSEDTPSTIPSQHIEARNTHATDGFGTFSSEDVEDETRSNDTWGPIRTVPAKMPSLQVAHPNLLRSNKGSLESLRSEREYNRQVSDDKTFTSWAHSGPSTLTSQQQQQWRELERQRLSIIKENGTHAPSSSSHRQPLEADLFQCPDNVGYENPLPFMSSVNSQRMISALMKRKAVTDAQIEPGVEQVQRSTYITPDVTDTPTRASRRSRSSDKQKAAPITNLGHRDAALTKAGTGVEEMCGALTGGRSPSGSTGTVGSRNGVPEPTGNDGLPLFGPSNSVTRARSVSDRNGAFFGSPSSHFFRTESPFRRALRQSMEEEESQRSQRPRNSAQVTELNDIVAAGSPVAKSDSDSAKDHDYSESVYSTDKIEVREQEDDASSKQQAVEPNKDEDAPVTYQPAGYREASSASSVDWKTWLSANIAKLDSSPTRLMPIEVEFALPTMPKSFPSPSGHVREATQIHGEDDGDESDYFAIPVVSTRQPTLPTTPLSSVELNVVKLTPVQRCIKRSTPPSSMPMTVGRMAMSENDSPGGLSAPPPIPLKSALRPSPLKITRPLNSVGGGGVGGRSITTPSIQSSPRLTAAVQKQFGPVCSGGSGGVEGRTHRVSGSGGRGGRFPVAGKFLEDCTAGVRWGGDAGDRSLMSEDDGARAFI
ncbi:hypothetical protein QBC38DRAFT_411097 [Podospora fimiseda]|uniref:Uncharacterized protein n=1 Tax=Podospora fimiseda TaxID=252190 RepID=A0AAN7GZ77_9PEZI|nr:hypothetical protein QBC38DRAFT_411097 [Podospora fimiseda]